MMPFSFAPPSNKGAVASSVVVCLILLLSVSFGITDGFNHYHPRCYRHRPVTSSKTVAATEKSVVSLFASSTTPSSSSSLDRKRISPGVKRRAVLEKIVATAATSTAALYYRGQNGPQGLQPSEAPAPLVDQSSTSLDLNEKNRLLSVDQAMVVLEASCDRRFLHAVVGTDYRLMYRGITKEDSKRPSIIGAEPSDLLLPSTYGSKEAADYFLSLEDGAMAKKPIRPSNGHLATTSIKDAKKWGGYAASIWPLDGNVHYAWQERGGNFWPATAASRLGSTPDVVIIDGVDCGTDSLDYALERDNSEIMFKADRYLVIPTSMEDQLVSRLRSSFII